MEMLLSHLRRVEQEKEDDLFTYVLSSPLQSEHLWLVPLQVPLWTCSVEATISSVLGTGTPRAILVSVATMQLQDWLSLMHMSCLRQQINKW